MPRTHLAIAAAVTAAALSAVSFAHDEDWRKLADRTDPNFGEIYRNVEAGESIDTTSARSARANGLTLLSQVPLNQLDGTNVGDGSDCWGFVTKSGREIAIMGKANGHGFVDITDPTNPVVIGFIGSASSFWHDVKVVGDYAYAVNEGGNGIQVIDISDADNGNIRLVRNVTQGGHSTTHNIIANEDSGWLYICGANVANGGLVAVDISDPENPTFAGQWSNRYVHDAQVVTMTQGPFAGREIAFCFNGEFGIDILDVTNKSNITRLGGGTYPLLRYCHQGWISEDEQWLYVNDELDEGSTVSVTTTRVFRIYDPNYTGPAQNEPSLTNPVFVGTFTTGITAVDHNLYIDEGVIFQANYQSGLRVFDATQNPASPTEIAFFDTFPQSDQARFNGAWSVYPFFPSGNIIVSDIESGLFVFRLDVGPSANSILLDVASVPSQANPQQPITITATATPNNTSISGEGVRLAYTVGDSDEIEIPMTPTENLNEFQATIPGQDCFQTIGVRVIANSAEEKSFATPVQEIPVFQDEVFLGDSESNTAAWTTAQTASTGSWEFGIPANGDRGDPPSDSDGTGSAWVTENVAGNSDVDGGTVSLVSEPFDLSLGGTVQFDYWFSDIPTGPLGPEDFYRVEVRTQGGTWQVFETYTNPAAQWRTDTITFGDGADYPASAGVQLRFTVADNSPGHVVEGGLDALTVFRRDCEDQVSDPCPADVDGTNQVDIEDLLLVLREFGISNLGDTDGDSDTDIEDLLTVLREFGSNC